MSLRSAAPAAPGRPASLPPFRLIGVALALASSGALAQTVTTAPNALPAVTVVGDTLGDLPAVNPGGQTAKGGSLGVLGTSDNMDIPFSTQNYTAEFMEEQQARTAADTLINDASVTMTTGRGGFADTYQVRGFAFSEHDVGFNGLYGLIPTNRVSAELIERLELFKGPASFLSGMSPGASIGGGINIVSKRAGDEPLTRLTTTYVGSKNFGLHADVGRRFGADKEWGIRVNGLVRGGEGSTEGGDQKTALGSVALEYDRGGLRWSLDAFAKRDDTDNYRPQISLQTVTSYIPEPPDARSNWYPGTTLVQDDKTIVTRIEYDVNDALTVYGGIGYRKGINDQLFPVSVRGSMQPDGRFRVQSSWYDAYSKALSGNAGLRWRVATGPVKHTFTVGYSALQLEEGNAYIAQPGSVASSIYYPAALAPITLARTDPTRASDTDLSSLAVADTMSFLDDRLLLTVGVRRQNVDVQSYSTTTGQKTTRYDSSANLPLAGIVWRFTPNLSVYGNYSTALSRGQTVGTQYANRGEVLAPYRSKQLEAGIKANIGRMQTSAAVFQIERPIGGADPVTNVYGYIAEQRNRGIELNATGEITRGLRGYASLALMDPKLTKTINGVDQGNDAAGVPNRRFSAGLDWDVPGVRGLALNGRVVHASGAYLTNSNALRFDGWTRFDIGARYRFEASGRAVVLRANIENLADKNYWLTTGNYVAVGAGRTLMLSASVDF
ncbi:TonB-dependent receptor [Xenophilus arseniciresistens]|uniref:TonB-dependent receptor n=1 Tax=Xenophilus arseniciresistens TaxID=1283306 RepID=A0AAE3NEA7_9BURK|nr:TonB-dependent receptor [Xenophilus arseniciresistens]MDA7418707.1 TonB-dependent receptor [Xenophilus arseniciresistens]